MKQITYFIKFFYRIRYWLILAPAIILFLVYSKTKNTPSNYTVDCSIYTGIITGVNILSESGVSTTSYTQGSMLDNLLNIITSDQTLKQVSLRLYSRIMVYGDLNKDNIYINAAHYRSLYDHGAPIRHLIDKTSTNDSINEERTYEKLKAYETSDPSNYVYGIYQWNLPYVNRESLQKINVTRAGNSDMFEISYTTDDPGIAYQTLRILIKEFIIQYQELRFGETNEVISYFEKELKRISQELKFAEDSLTDYRVENKVINYEEETKHVAALNRDFELQYWLSESDFLVADSLKQELEKRMGISTEILRQNNDYLYYNDKISKLNEQLSIANYYSNSNISPAAKDSLKLELEKAGKGLEAAIQGYSSLQYSKEGVANADVVSEWLKQVMAYKKGEAELKVLKDRGKSMGEKYIHFAPIGSTLNRRERTVNIAEKEYFSIMDALNSARLRQKSLQMTSATLKVMNEPSYPLTSIKQNHYKIYAGVFIATLIFIIFFSLLIELLDHTLHHKFKAEQLTGSQIIGAFTRPLRFKGRRYNQVYTNISTQVLCNHVTTYFKSNQNNIINLISNEPHEGKSFLMEKMAEQFTNQGLEVKQLSWQDNKQTDAKSFIQSLNLDDDDLIGNTSLKDCIILVEYPPLKEAAISPEILQGVSLNLQIVDSRRTWKNTDQQLFTRTKEMAGKTPVFIVLNYTKLDAAEDLNGLMPPFSFFRKLFYRISQLGLTANDKHYNHV